MCTRVVAVGVACALAVAPALHAQQDTETKRFAPGVARPGPGIVMPKPTHRQTPTYTPEATRAGIQGEVWVEAVVLDNGTVGDVRVAKSLDKLLGLDERALEAARAWRFEPARRGDEPISLVVTLILMFRVDKDEPATDSRMYPPGPASDDEFLAGVIDARAPGVRPPVVQTAVQAAHTAEAIQARVQGVVEVEAVVEPDGSVSRVRVRKGLRPDLDRNAMAAALQFRFAPGVVNGMPTSVLTVVTIEFRRR